MRLSHISTPISAVPDPMEVAAAANDKAATVHDPVDTNSDGTGANKSEALDFSKANTNTAAAISDSFSNVTIETTLDPSETEDATPKPNHATPAPAQASHSLAAPHSMPCVALVSAAIITITGFLV
ncbi:hypothetical protein PsorP6_003336 [Peronosclerospora sorghi]|uniref:Uncharacterized protein n=1 Tax=Peronosclerospora sorghi TaxID=230839 RepID=A0ACC0VN70_9STRA|nr:hypothetical protein PsorP6_003336 [Peronosclerospora sorghi]